MIFFVCLKLASRGRIIFSEKKSERRKTNRLKKDDGEKVRGRREEM